TPTAFSEAPATREADADRRPGCVRCADRGRGTDRTRAGRRRGAPPIAATTRWSSAGGRRPRDRRDPAPRSLVRRRRRTRPAPRAPGRNSRAYAPRAVARRANGRGIHRGGRWSLVVGHLVVGRSSRLRTIRPTTM